MPFIPDSDQQVALATPQAQHGFVPDPEMGDHGHGVWDAMVSGWQNSASGLMVRGKLPDVQLDPSHASWVERAAQGLTSTAADLPEMALGAFGGAAAGSALAPGVGTVIGGGAGAMAVPAAIRESLIQAYQAGDAGSSGDFLSRAAIVLKQTGKAALIGGLTAGVGGKAAQLAGGTFAPAIGEAGGVLASRLAGEVGAMSVAPAALEGRLPEPQDFVDAAIVVAGMKVAGKVAGKMSRIYAETGIPPEQVVADAKTHPEIAEQLKADTPVIDLPKEYEPIAAAEAAQRAIPDPKFLTDEQKQAFLDKPFADYPQEPGEPKVELYPNINYIDTPDHALAAIARATELVGDKIVEQTRGRVPIAQQEHEMAVKLAEMVGVNDVSLLQARTPGTGAGTTEMWIRGQLMTAAAEEFATKALDYDPLSASPLQGIELTAAAERVAMLSANFQGAASETGRALQALKMINAGMRQADAIKKLMDGTPDPAKIAEIMKKVDNPVAAAKVARQVTAPKPLNGWQQWQQVYKAGLLSGFKTYQVKALGDSVATSSNIAERMVAAGIGLLHGGEKVTFTEAVGLITGMKEGARDALKVGAEVWSKEGFAQSETNAWEGHRTVFGQGEDGAAPKPGTAAALANKVIALPHRVMGAETEAFRTLNELGEANAQAIRQAVSEKFTPGTREFAERVVAIKATPSEVMRTAIKQAGDDATFTGKLGTLGTMMQNISRNDFGGFILPFSTVPANLVSWAVKRMPGVGVLLGTVREDLMAGGARRDIAIARQVIGATVAMAAYGAVQKGTLTGGGTYLDPNQKNAKIDAGWQPYSIKIGDKYWSYARFEPLARVAATAADAAEIHDHLNEDDKANLPKMVAMAFGNALVSQTYLAGLNGLLQALDKPYTRGSQYFDTFVGSWVPALFGQLASASDPHARRIDSVFDELKSKIPGMRQQLLPKVNTLTGQPLQNVGSMDITPVNVSDIAQDPVLTEAARLGVGVAKAPKSIELPSAHDRAIGKVELKPEQQNLFSTTSGQMVHSVMSNLVGSDAWEAMPDFFRKRAFEIVLEKSHQAAKAKVLTPEQRMAEAQRIVQELQVKLHKRE